MRAMILALFTAWAACCLGQIPFEKTEREQLSHSQLRVFYPSYLPTGFHKTSFSFDDHSADSANFHVTYMKKGASLTIQMGSSGVGDIIFTGKHGETAS